ncbi:hypothetical protein SO802_010721 [Lithocarpus litseifolius]|uniref:Leucine-rich repeat-containing N-terminal plant-type domain-containing protein n=1 Tax=Lithocarpus litseifolius TaxID=425828 RepID=A0AAW2DI18_9ROSI
MPLCLSDQSSALLHFRNSFSVRHSGLSNLWCDLYSYPPKNSWKMGTDCCGWDGVTCDTMTGHVIGVDLSCSGLQGPIHPNTTLFSLRHLQRLNLAYNHFHGSTISSKFGGFANMTHLNLTWSSVAGSSIVGYSLRSAIDLKGHYKKGDSKSKTLPSISWHDPSVASDLYNYIFFQDNVFVIVVTSIQYWALSDKAADAFYKLSNTRAQIQSHVFDACDFEIVQMLVVDTEPNEYVKRAVSKINATTAVNGSLWWVCFENRPKPLVVLVFENRAMDNNRTSHGSREILLYLIKPWFKLNVIVKVYFPISYFHNLVS